MRGTRLSSNLRHSKTLKHLKESRQTTMPLNVVLESKDELMESGREQPPRISPNEESSKKFTEVSHKVTVNESLRGSTDTEAADDRLPTSMALLDNSGRRNIEDCKDSNDLSRSIRNTS